MNPQLDPQALNLAKSIRRAETGSSSDPYNAKGASGETGAYQYMPDTWKQWSSEFLGNPNAEMSVENQNKVAYSRIKKWKDEGYNPAQIASMWNSGRPDAYINNGTGTNKYGVKYDVPGYVSKVSNYYREISGSGQPQQMQQPQMATPQMGGVPNVLTTQQLQAQHASQPVDAPQEVAEPQKNIFQTIIEDPIKTLLVKPADRIAEVIGRSGVMGEDVKKGYELMSDQGESRSFAGIEVEPQKAFGEGGAKQIGGEALKAGSYLYSGGKLPEIASKGIKGLIGQGALQGAKVGALTGGMYGAGAGMQEEGSTLGSIATDTAIGAGGGLVAGGVLGGVGAGLAPAIRGGVKLAQDKEKFAQELIQKDVDTLLKNGRAMTNATSLVKQKNVPIEEILSDPEVFRGLKVEDRKIVPDDAVALLDERIEAMMKAKAKLLPEFDRILMPVSRETVRARAKQNIAGEMLPDDEVQIMQSIDRQIDAMPETLTMSQLDDFRAKARKSARNARGLQKSDNEYAAIENATRDVLFDATDNLPQGLDTNKEFPALNNEIKNLIVARDFVDKTLRGRNAPGAGWAREAVSRLIGGIAGGSGGPLGVILGSEMGRVIANIVANKNLGNSIKMKLIQNITDDQKVLSAAEELLGKAKGYDPVAERLALPAPKSIQVGPAGSTRPQQPMNVVPAEKGLVGQKPKGTEGAGKFFGTYSSTPKGLIPPKNKSNPAVVPFGGVAGVEQNEEGEMQVDPLKAGLGMGVAGLVSRGKGFQNFSDLSTKLLGKLEGKEKVSKQFISDLTNSPDLKQPERDLIRRILEKEGNQVNVPEFADKVKDELLPLGVKDRNSMPAGFRSTRYENISLPSELRGQVKDYDERIYESPVKTSAGGVHFGNSSDSYFAHSRIEDMADGQTRRVIEAQSDLFQKGRLNDIFEPDDGKTAMQSLEGLPESAVKSAQADAKAYDTLAPYRNTWHERIVREEVKKASQDGKTKLQFPTGETSMKIEGLGDNYAFGYKGEDGYTRNLRLQDLKIGKEVGRINGPGGMMSGSKWVITDVLGDGKFKAIPKRAYEIRSQASIKELPDGRYEISSPQGARVTKNTKEEAEQLLASLLDLRDAEQFDISGSVDKENPIYKFYEKEMAKYLKNKFGAQLVTDPQGVTWWEVPVKKEQAKLPVEAFGVAPLIALPQMREKEKKQ